MNDKTLAVVLGGTFPHIELVNNLKGRGYYVLLIDYFKNPPAKTVADEHIQESTLDRDKVLEIAQRRNANLVISTCIDQANVTACYVAEKLELPTPYSYETAIQVSNKVLMKEKMLSSGIPTSRYFHIQKIDDLQNHDLDYPVIVKPVDSNSSKGVSIAENAQELLPLTETALKLSRNGGAIVEEFVKGQEIGIDCFVVDGVASVLLTKERRKFDARFNGSQQIYGCLWPANLDEAHAAKFSEVANSIAKAFRLQTTPLMIQAIVKGNQVSVIEFAPRIGGGESFRLIKLSTGFDYIDAAVDSFVTAKPEMDAQAPNCYYAETFLYAYPGDFGQISGCDHLLETGSIEYWDSLKKKGATIGEELSSNNRVGVFTVKAKSKKEIHKKIMDALEQIEVYSTEGAPILRRDIYGRQ